MVVLFDTEKAELAAVIEADKLGQLRTGAASGVAAKHARAGGGGVRSGSSAAAGRRAPRSPAFARRCRGSSAWSPTAGSRGQAEEVLQGGRLPSRARGNRDAAEQDVVVTATTSKDPVLRGEWLREGALVCAIGANDPRRRELDNVVLERAAFVCCDSGRAVAPGVGRPDRAGRGPACSTGSRCTSCRR